MKVESKFFKNLPNPTTEALHRGTRTTEDRETIIGSEMRCKWLIQSKKYTKHFGIIGENNI